MEDVLRAGWKEFDGRSRVYPPETPWGQSDAGDYGDDVEQGVFGESGSVFFSV